MKIGGYSNIIYGALCLRRMDKQSLCTHTTIGLKAIVILVARACRTISAEAVFAVASMIPWNLLRHERAERASDEKWNLSSPKTSTLNKWSKDWVNRIPDRKRHIRAEWAKTLILDLAK